MNATDSIQALRRANPRVRPHFAHAVDIADTKVRAAIAVDGTRSARPRLDHRRRLVRRLAAGGAVAAAGAALLTFGTIGGGTGVESATAAVERAATVTAASAERSGTADVVMTHDRELWVQKTVRWNGADVAIGDRTPMRGGPGRELRVVDGTMYGVHFDGSWIELGSPGSIDPDSGTTPDEHLAAVREDIGGVTLRRITRGVNGLVKVPLADGSAVYRGTVSAGLIARETGSKEGESIRVFPFGYVAHDEAADPASPLDVAVTVGADDQVRSIAVSWGARAAAWTYTVTYSDLGTTPAITAPANARPFPDRSPAEPPRR